MAQLDHACCRHLVLVGARLCILHAPSGRNGGRTLMGSLTVTNLGKAYKQYSGRWSRLLEWITPGNAKRHHLKWVLQDINLTILPGEAVGILGINGAGKSTLLKMITGTTQPTTGCVQINGRVAALLELGMGFHQDFTGRQNVYMAGQLLGYSIEEIALLMPEIEAFAEIAEYIDQPVRVYSSGMQMRLAFSVATARKPDILIVDEALSVGDIYFQSKCYARVAKYKKEGMTLLLVSHAAMDVVKQCNRAVFIDKGRIIADGPSRDVTNLYLDKISQINRFTKKSAISKNSNNLTRDHLPTGKEDVYHKRFGYRKEEYRWGKGGARILDYSITVDGESFPKIIETNSTIEICFSVIFDDDIDYVTAGLLIKTLEGLFIYGTNSYLSSKNECVIHGKKDQLIFFRFEFKVSLNEGNYLLSLGISAGDPSMQTEPIDRRYDSILINVRNPKHMWGLVDLHAEFNLYDDGK
jgi:lipopolysaccharide transport system ATP-binding protein